MNTLTTEQIENILTEAHQYSTRAWRMINLAHPARTNRCDNLLRTDFCPGIQHRFSRKPGAIADQKQSNVI
jgi:hypothetical protein